MKVLINVIGSNGKLGYNAAGKAKSDADHTLTENNYIRYNILFRRDLPKSLATALNIKDIIKLCIKLKLSKPEDIIIQYPGMGIGTRSISLISKLLRKQPLTLLIHDIDSLRYFGEISDREKKILNNASSLIVHTENMKSYLIHNNITTKMRVMELFDYYAKGQLQDWTPSFPYSLVFAGNLEKSKFLQDIGNKLAPHILYLYGVKVDTNWNNGLIYEGKFEPDCINDIKGDWGLVWDGDSTDTCTGRVGDYLKYNSSHKASLYLASGKPLIVWSKSALAEIVKKYNVGITVDSINEIPEHLKSIDMETYQEIRKNITAITAKLRTGGFLKSVLN